MAQPYAAAAHLCYSSKIMNTNAILAALGYVPFQFGNATTAPLILGGPGLRVSLVNAHASNPLSVVFSSNTPNPQGGNPTTLLPGGAVDLSGCYVILSGTNSGTVTGFYKVF